MTTPTQIWTTADVSDYPDSPYPGGRPVGSWRVTADRELHRVSWCTDSWVDQATAEPVPVSDRHLVLGYGSNLNPAKLVRNFPGEEVVVLQTTVVGWAAAWCRARRASGDVVATLVRAPGTEVHAALALTDRQLEEMDRWEGHPRFYRRQPFDGIAVLENGRLFAGDVYIGTDEQRPSLAVGGTPLLLCDAPYHVVDAIVPVR